MLTHWYAIVLATIGDASPDTSGVLRMFPWFGIPLLQMAYSLAQGRLPAMLYPEHLRAPGSKTA